MSEEIDLLIPEKLDDVTWIHFKPLLFLKDNNIMVPLKYGG